MFTQTKTLSLRDRVLRSPLVDLLTGPHGVDRYTELVEPTWTLGDCPRQGRRGPPADAPQRHPDSRTQRGLRGRTRPARRPARQPHRRGRRAQADPLLLAGQRRGRPARRADHRRARRRAWSRSTCTATPGPAWSSASTASAATSSCPPQRPRRILFVSGGSGITPVLSMLRTLRARGLRPRRHLHPLRPHRRGGVLPRRARRHARRSGAARLLAFRRGRRPDGLLRTPNTSRGAAGSRRGLRLRSARAGRRRPRALPGRQLRELRPAGVRRPGRGVRRHGRLRRQRRRRHRRRSLAARAGRGRRPHARRADAGWASATPAPAARPAARSRTCITGAVSTADEEDVQICVSVPVGDVELAL